MANKKEDYEKIVPDTSVIIEGILSDRIGKDINVKELVIHEAVAAELEHQSNEGKAVGFIGLDELERLRSMADQGSLSIRFAGQRPKAGEIKYADLGEIDAMIRQLAFDEDATLFSADKVQARVARAKGISVVLIEKTMKAKKLMIEKYFDDKTMSVHLKEGVEPYAKKGAPGDWQFKKLESSKLTQENIKKMSAEIIEEARIRHDGFIEIEREGSTITQLGMYRIVTTKPPFSDGWEITAVRPVKRLGLKDYGLSEKLMQRIAEQAEGILIAGAPGHGKTTFAQGLAEFYAVQDKVVKTVEAPRDLVLADNVTQYAISRGSPQEIHDILLLARPDYTIFDEMRNTADFELFADMRLAGVGMIGVVHATNPVDAVQRFVGRIELGVIPQVIDTVIFIRNGQVFKVLGLNMTVKVPSGMTEADLARPVVTVTDFETQKLEFEIYSYGEETVVVPVKDGKKSASQQLAEKSIQQDFRRYSENVKVEMISDSKAVVQVPEHAIAKIIGRQGKNIEDIEKRLGISIDIQPLSAKAVKKDGKQPVDYDVTIKKNSIMLKLDLAYQNQDVDIYVGDDYLLTAKAGKSGIIKIKKDNKIGHIIAKAIQAGENLRLMV
ncbi:PIN domain-containing protein [Candidatus Woesearchaeota archaeon]|nr:PIN domain-containing protein [Candidatus Woesearchaeota archaeon]